MLYKSVLMLLVLLFMAVSVFAQEMEEGEMDMAPPQPLSNDWHQWLIGEWKGTSETNMGKTKDWMKIEWGPGKQFLVMHYKGKTTEVNQETLSQAAEKMNMPREQLKEMMMQDYYGLGITSLDPKTGEPMGYWFDSYRDISKGSGTLKDDKSKMTWTSEAMGSMTRVVEKVSKDKMTVKMHGKDPSGMEWSGTAEMTRVK